MAALTTLAALLGPTLLDLERSAAAQEDCQPSDGLSTCVASDNLWMYPGGGRFFSQAPTLPPPAGSVSFGFAPTYIHRPIGLEVASADPEGTTIFAVENVLAANFLIGVGITDRLTASFAGPVILNQRGAGKSDIVGGDDALPRAATGDIRLGVMVSVLPRDPAEEGLGLAGRFEIVGPSGQNDAFAGYRSATYAPGATVDYRLGDVTLAFDVNARLRRVSTLATANIGHQLATSLGVGYDVFDDGWLSVNLETWALIGLLEQSRLVENEDTRVVEEQDGPLHVPMEWMLSARTAGLLDGRFRASLGAGSFIPTASQSAVTTPAFRVALGLHYVFTFLDDEDDEDEE